VKKFTTHGGLRITTRLTREIGGLSPAVEDINLFAGFGTARRAYLHRAAHALPHAIWCCSDRTAPTRCFRRVGLVAAEPVIPYLSSRWLG
jgi:hypothetical protein